jgi:predicted HNH restriction endonuclease
MELKSEKSIREFLKTLPDDHIIKYYLDVEFSPFPVLIIEEYTRRFKQKTKDEIIKKLKYQARLAKRKSSQLTQMAKRKKLISDVTRQKSEEIIHQARKKGFKISATLLNKGSIFQSKMKKHAQKGIQASKNLRSSPKKDLDLLAKLGKLKKAGIITEKEFQGKKRKILKRI